MKIYESLLRNIIREEIHYVLNETAPDIDKLNLSQQQNCTQEYDLSVGGVKVYFTLPESYNEFNFGRSIIQARDAIRNLFTKGVFSTSSVIHAGIVFSDGTTLEPVSFIRNNPMINPSQTVVLLLKGTDTQQEEKIRKKAQEIIEFHEKVNTQQRYNKVGILGKIPFIGDMLMNVLPRQTNTFYCSQLVAYMLAYADVVTISELEKAKTLTEDEQKEDLIYKKDALSPSELYDMIKGKADLLTIRCKSEQTEPQASFEDLMNL